MKKWSIFSMLLILVCFSTFLSPSNELEDFSLKQMDESSINSIDVSSNLEAITVSAPSIIQKWENNALFPTDTAVTLTLRAGNTPFMFIKHATELSDACGFFSVVQHQSNYLS